MSSFAHSMHSAHQVLEHTGAGHKITGYAVAGTVAAAKAVGGAALVSTAMVAAPLVVPIALAGGAAYLLEKLNEHH